MDTEATRPSLLSRVRDPGDHDAWREFEARYGELLLRYARRRGLMESDAEDVRQVVLLDLSRSLRRFQYSPERGRFRDYLGRCVQNAVSRFRARQDPAQIALSSSVMAAVPANDESGAEAQWEREWVSHHYRLAMKVVRRTFDPRSVEIFDRILAGDAIKAIAASYGMTSQAVHQVKQRIRNRLRELVAVQTREEDEPDG